MVRQAHHERRSKDSEKALARAQVVAFGREIRYSVRHYIINPMDTFHGHVPGETAI